MSLSPHLPCNPDDLNYRQSMTTTSVPLARLTNLAAMRLICLPYAGGGSAAYFRWRSAIPAQIDLVPLALPGHDGRLHEPPCTNLRGLSGALADDLQSALDRPYALLGHSLGAWLAFELVRELRRRNGRLPRLLVVAAGRPPHEPSGEAALHRLPDSEFLAAVEQRYTGIPAAVRNQPELLQMLLPVLRADLQMVETYQYIAEPPLDVDILAIGGADDPTVSAGQLAEWQRHTTRDCSVRLVPGGHFFLFRGVGETQPSTTTVTSGEAPPALRMIIARLQDYLSATTGDPKPDT